MAAHYTADVLIVGAGGAGLRAAIAAHDAGANVLIVCKSLLGKAHTVMAEGGIAAALDTGETHDDWQTHFRDTMLGGKMLNDWHAAELHAREAPDEVVQLERWGALFDRTPDGRILQRRFGGHSRPRLAHVGDRTGLELIRTLQDEVVARRINVLMEHTITHVAVREGIAIGAVGYDRATGDLFDVSSASTIIATGGAGMLYAVNSNSWESTADGLGLALRAGTQLTDMEFVQFHPTGMVAPASVRGLLVTEAVRGEGGLLLNARNERFMKRYDSARMELSTRDVVARAIYNEVAEGRGSPNGGVYLTVAHLPSSFIRKKLPSMYAQFLTFAGIDITHEPMEVFPTTHYLMGGIRVNAETGESSVPGLFAAGEAAAGLHGANRLGGNSLSDLLVFGRRTGTAAATRAAGRVREQLPADMLTGRREEMYAPLQSDAGDLPSVLLSELAQIMVKHVGVFRSEASLRTAVGDLLQLRRRSGNLSVPGSSAYNPAWQAALQLPAMIDVALSIARSALMREESRGAHTRVDHPGSNPELELVNTIVTQSPKGAVDVGFANRNPIPHHLIRLVETAAS